MSCRMQGASCDMLLEDLDCSMARRIAQLWKGCSKLYKRCRAKRVDPISHGQADP